jgi:hypothetical protein
VNKAHAERKLQESEKTTRNIEYQPPDEQVFEQLAERFCETLNKRGDMATTAEMAVGLAEFLTVVARLTAKSLSKSTNQPPHKPNQ